MESPIEGSPTGGGDTAGDGRRLPDDSLARIVLRPVASPLPLGFLAFGVGTLLLSLLEVKAIPTRESMTVGLFIAAAIFPTEAAAAVVAALARDAPSLSAMGLLSGSWLAFGLHFVLATPGTTSVAVGVLAFGIGGSLLLVGLVGAFGKRLLAAVLLVAAGRYAVFGLYQVTGDRSLNTASAIVGLVLVVVCAYGALALLVEEATQRTILPVFRTGRSSSSLEGGIQEQLEPLEQEPGVRSQL